MIKIEFKRGIAMIELIFAIVVIGIVLLSTPMLIQQSVNSGYVALQQESIAAVSSHTRMLLSKPWQNIDNSTNISKSLKELKPEEISFGRNFDRNLTILPIGADLNDTYPNDIDDYDTKSFSIHNVATTNAISGDYIDQNITISTDITFTNDSRDIVKRSAGSVIDIGNSIYNNQDIYPNRSYIKFVKVNLSTRNKDIPELEKNITLNAFSCYLGKYNFGEKEFK
jgi:hypothetical protein